jgi:hypothetical protein
MTEKATKGGLTLADYPIEMVRLACDRCDRRGQYRRGPLISLLGAKATLSDALVEMAKCPRAHDASNPCGAHFLDPSPH